MKNTKPYSERIAILEKNISQIDEKIKKLFKERKVLTKAAKKMKTHIIRLAQFQNKREGL